MKKGKVLAIDYGSKRIGTATGDFEVGVAFPRSVIQNVSRSKVLSEIESMVGELSIETIVVGLPLKMEDGQQENRIMNDVRFFVDKLKKKFPEIDVQLFDERLSSFEADQLIKDLEKSGNEKALGRDAYAACVILQRFFDNNS